MILGIVGSLALGRFVPKGDARCRFVVIVVLDVLGNVLKAFHPVQGMQWWRCWRINPHGDEAVGWALFVVVDN